MWRHFTLCIVDDKNFTVISQILAAIMAIVLDVVEYRPTYNCRKLPSVCRRRADRASRHHPWPWPTTLIFKAQQTTVMSRARINKLSARGRREGMHPRRWQFDSRLSADGSMAKLQAASVPIAQDSCAPRAAAPWDRQTDGSRYRLMPLYGGGHKMKVERRTVQKLERKNTTAATTEFLIFLPKCGRWQLYHNSCRDNDVSQWPRVMCVAFWVLRLILFLEGLLKTANILFQFDR